MYIIESIICIYKKFNIKRYFWTWNVYINYHSLNITINTKQNTFMDGFYKNIFMDVFHIKYLIFSVCLFFFSEKKLTFVSHIFLTQFTVIKTKFTKRVKQKYSNFQSEFLS